MNQLFLAMLLIGGQMASAADSMTLVPELGKVVGQCDGATGKKQVWFVKQWHLSPSVNTKRESKDLPQKENQLAIYRQLAKWIDSKMLKTVLAEGCSGEINEATTLSFNGWSMADLKLASATEGFADIVTSVPMKLEAQYGDQLSTLCADDDALIKEHALALSDARGAFGFMTRLTENKEGSAIAKSFMETAVRVYKLPANSSQSAVVAHTKKALREAVARAEKALEKRNEKIVSTIMASKDDVVAVVFGGSHASGVKKLLEAKKIGCSIVEPVGYNNDEDALAERLHALIK